MPYGVGVRVPLSAPQKKRNLSQKGDSSFLRLNQGRLMFFSDVNDFPPPYNGADLTATPFSQIPQRTPPPDQLTRLLRTLPTSASTNGDQTKAFSDAASSRQSFRHIPTTRTPPLHLLRSIHPLSCPFKRVMPTPRQQGGHNSGKYQSLFCYCFFFFRTSARRYRQMRSKPACSYRNCPYPNSSC